jgi:hypothetical protein
MNGKVFRTFRLAITGAMIGLTTAALAANLTVAGSPAYNVTANTGLKDGMVPLWPGAGVNNYGTAVGYAEKYTGIYLDDGPRAVRWDFSGTAATELGSLGTNSTGYTIAKAFAINDSGTAVGWALKYVNGASSGSRAVRWDATGTAAIELANLGTDSSGFSTGSGACAINDDGMAAGFSQKYVNGINMGARAVRWDASGTVATELGSLGTDANGVTNCYTTAMNAAGTVVGYSEQYVDGSDVGPRPVRWDASCTAAVELGNLGLDGNGKTATYPVAVNNSGAVVGYAEKFVNGSDLGVRAVRWSATGTAATELDNLGTDGNGRASAQASAINKTGTIVGYAVKYIGGINKGRRAVRWDPSGTAVTELGTLGQDSTGGVVSSAYALNDAGTTVGYAWKYLNGKIVGSHAAIWLPDTSVIDVNSLGITPVPAGGTWTLTTAKALSADGWVSGEGTFDADGSGPLASYTRLWVAQVGLGGTWTNAAGGTWGRGPNWSTGTPAMQVGNATFNLNSAYTVALDRDELTKTITISAGTVTLSCNGHTLSTESGLSIGNGATLKAAGTIISNVAVNSGTLAAGASPGTLSITGNLTSSSTLQFEIASLANFDQINVTGAFNAGGTISVSLLDGYVPAAGDTFDLMDFGNFVNNGYVFDLAQAGLPSGLYWDTAAFATIGSISVVPEPGTLALVGMAGMSLLAFARLARKR